MILNKRLIILILFLTLGLRTDSEDREPKYEEIWQIGRYTLMKVKDGFVARSGDTISHVHKKAIESIHEVMYYEEDR